MPDRFTWYEALMIGLAWMVGVWFMLMAWEAELSMGLRGSILN